MLTVQQSTTKAFNVYFGVSGLTVTATLSKNGGAFNSVSPTITDRSNGYYSIAPIAAHRDTIGENAWLFSASGQPSLPRVEQVIAADIDAAIQPVNVTQMAANVITASAIAADAVTEIQTGLATALQVEQFVAASELNLESLLVDIPTVAEFNARTLASADYFVVGDYTAPDNAGIAANGVAIGNVPTLAEIEASTVLAKEATVAAKASQTSVDGKPTLAQIEASAVIAKEATLGLMSGATFNTSTDSLEAIRNRGDVAWVTGSGGGGGITGDYTITLTVTDSDTADPIEGATVTLSRTGERATSTTNASGVATIGADAATWTYVIRAAGYEIKTGTVVVTDDTTLDVDMDSIVQASTDPDKSMLTILCLDQNGDAEADVDIDIRIIEIPSGDINVAYKGTKQTAVSAVDGYASLEAIKGAVYEYKRGKAEVWSKVTIGQGSSTNVQSIIGSP